LFRQLKLKPLKFTFFIAVLIHCLDLNGQNNNFGVSLDPLPIYKPSLHNWFQIFFISQFNDSQLGFHGRLCSKKTKTEVYQSDAPTIKLGITYRFHQYHKTQFLLGAFYSTGMIYEEFKIEFPDYLGNFALIQEKSSTIINGFGIEFIMIHPIAKRLSFVHLASLTYHQFSTDESSITKKYPGLNTLNIKPNILDWTLGLSYRF
jgi:hypothetical protein